MERVSLLTGVNNQDYDYTALHLALFDSVVLSGLAVTYGAPNIQIALGKAFVKCTKTNGKQQIVIFESDATKTISSGFTLPCKVWIEINQANLDAVTGNSPAGTSIGSIKAGAAYPAGNFCPLASINGGGVVTDERVLTIKRSMLDKYRDSHYFASNTGTDAYILNTGYSLPAIPIGVPLTIKTDVANTGTATLNFDGLGAILIKKMRDQDLETGDIEAGQLLVVEYDGTFFQMISQTAQLPATLVDALTDSSYYAGETIVSGYQTILEGTPLFADATTIDFIGNAALATRWTGCIFGSGVGFTTRKLSLRKYASPPASLSISIQPDVAGAPSGTPVANGTATVTAASLSTSLQDIIVTFAGTVTLTVGVKYRIVANMVGDVTDASNYYGIGVTSLHPRARTKMSYNGSAWAVSDQSSQATGLTFSSDSNSTERGIRITANANARITGVTRPTGFTGYSRCRIKNAAGTVLATSTVFFGRTFIFDYAITSGTDYRVELDNNGGSLTYGYQTTGALAAGPYYTAQSGSSAGGDHANMNSVESIQFDGVFPGGVPYTSLDGVLEKIVAHASAKYSYWADIHGICKSGASVGSKPIIQLPVKGTISNTLSGLTDNTALFLSDTLGQVSTTAGTNKVKVGDAVGTTGIRSDKRLLHSFPITTPANNTAWQNTTGKTIEFTVDSGTVTVIATSKDNVTFRTQWTATAHSVILQPGDWVKITWSVSPTTVGRYM